jgi:hypothetical protein
MNEVKIRVKRSLIPGQEPGLLSLGELAVNIADKKIFIGTNTGNVLLSDFSIIGEQLSEAIRDLLNTTIIAGENVVVDYEDTENQLTISVPNDVLSTALELILVAGENITITPTTDNTITISSTAGAETLWSNSNATTATDINGIPAGTTGLVGDNAIEILERILYPFQVATIPSFTMSGATTTYEIGATAATPLFTWTLTNTSNISALTFTYQRVTDGGLPNGTTSPSIANATNYDPSIGSLTTSTIGAGMNFFLTATQSNPLYASAVSTTRSIRWWSRMYWGRSSSTAETTYANLTNSSNTLLTSSGSFTQSVSFGSSSGTYLYIYFHSGRTLSSIILNTNNNVVTDSFTQLSNQTITNAHGVSVTYKVYRSVETLAGSDTYTVNLT